MPLNFFCKSFFLAVCIGLWAVIVRADFPHQVKRSADLEILQLYQTLNLKQPIPLPDRIVQISGQFLAHPYELGSLGEGERGQYDQMPLYRTDAFDCETFVDTVLALALSHDLPQFQQVINQIRYHNGHVAYTQRNHFTCLDWNRNNQRQGFVKDITLTLGKNTVKFARAYIDKPSWYRHRSLKSIRLKHAESNPLREKRLKELQSAGAQIPGATAIIPYIPLTALFGPSGKANQALFQQIPNASIIEIIRPNWDLTSAIGTHLNVSHLGFAIWHHGTLYFREASSHLEKVVDIPMEDYLRETLQSPSIKGINVQAALTH
ncbi:MAG: DUF1460 domain-containing protein [Legionellales bacterium]|nr:DUF1460 domain-containing protein [Legionellales bacterium]